MATILLVEDDASVRRFARLTLEQAGYPVLAAADGTTALRMAQRLPVPIALLVVDLILPDLEGQAVAQRLRAGHPALRVIFTSGYTGNWHGRQALTGPLSVFLPKPYPGSVLQLAVRTMLDG